MRYLTIIFIVTCEFIFAQALAANRVSPRVIYGQDSRLDYYEVSDHQIRELSTSTVALISAKKIEPLGQNQFGLFGESYQKVYNLCTTEKFLEQQTSSFCSGVLISDDLVLTAGHCLLSESECESTRFVFGYNLAAPAILPSVLQAEQIYSCQKLIVSQHRGSADFALVRLDRAVVDYAPAPLRRVGDIEMSDDVWMAGYPQGLPMKITSDAQVRSNDKYEFEANLDAFQGNSGSPVFNSATGEVEGLLVQGEDDFNMLGKSCRKINRCTDSGCAGETVSKINSVVRYMGRHNIDL